MATECLVASGKIGQDQQQPSLTLTSRLTHRLPKQRWTGHPTALIPFTLIKGDLQGGAHYATSTSA